jgi:hypothetical protein
MTNNNYDDGRNDPAVRETMTGFQAALYGRRVTYEGEIPVRPIVAFRTIVDPELKKRLEAEGKQTK